MTDFLPAIFLGIILSFTIGPVFFTILEISVSKGFKAAVFFNIGVVFSEIVFFAIAYASTSSLLESIQENPSWKILGGVLLSFYAGITLLGMYQNKEEASQYRFDPKSESPNIIKNMIKGFLLNIINFAVLVFWILVVANYGPGFQDTEYKMVMFFLAIVGTYFSIDLGKIYLAQQLKSSLTKDVITKIKIAVNGIILIIGLVLIFKGFLLNIINFAVLVFWILVVANYGPGFQDTEYKMVMFFLAIVGTYFSIDLGKIYLAQQLKSSLTKDVITKIKIAVNVIILIIGLVLIFKGFFE